MYKVRKRTGKLIEFDLAKISNAITLAFDACEKQYNQNIIDFLALKVTANFEPKIKNGAIAVEDIQDSVEQVLIQADYAEVAKAYILYRRQHEKLRSVKNTLLDYWREIHRKAGYVEISTPMIMNKQLWMTSGHWDHYKDNMYSTVIDDEEYCIKPMNCPGGVLVYASQPRSYRDLPIRAGEIGTVHRHEMRGALHGLFRVRCFNQDDAHLFVRPDQLTDEIVGVVRLIDSVYQQFGFKYHVELSTRPDDSMGSDEDWEAAENGLKTALAELGMNYELNEGDGAFYGPKIDFHLEDSLGRTWQCGTVQLDFQMPLNFDLEYTDHDGSKKRPIMLHRVCYGSIERFIGILIEHFAGKFPTWLSPVQVKVLPVSEKSRDYAHQVASKLEEAGVRVVVDDRDEKIGYKIREARGVDRVPYMLILGEKEAEEGNISVRDRSNETVQKSIEEFVAEISKEIADRA